MTLRDALNQPLPLPAVGGVEAPETGELWAVSAEGEDRGAVLIAAVRHGYVLAWPVTMPNPAASAPAFLVDAPHIGTLVVWPEAEFGLAESALDRRLSRALDSRAVRAVRAALTDPDIVPGVAFCPAADSDEALEALGEVCSQAWALGEWGWPAPGVGQGVLDSRVLGDAGIGPRDLARALRLAPGAAAALATGRALPTDDQIAEILPLLPAETGPEDLLAPVAGDEADVLSRPSYKREIAAAMAKTGKSEGPTRSVIWEAATSRAARQSAYADPLEAAKARVDEALADLLGGA